MARAKLIDRPIFVIGCNRSGTTLMFRNLSEHPVTWSLYEESQHVYYSHFPVDDELGDRLAGAPASSVAEDLERVLFAGAHNKEVFSDRPLLKHIPRKLLQHQLNSLYKRAPIRLVDKTPANCLRIPLLASVFPDARFVFLIRRAEDVISSLMEGWKYWSKTGTSEWVYGDWHYIVPPGWQDWKTKSLQDICAFQWVESNRTAWADFHRCCPDRFLLVRHEDAMRDPTGTYDNVRQFCDLPGSSFFDRQVARVEERVFTHGGSAPRVGKWQTLHEAEVESVRWYFQPLMDQFYPESRQDNAKTATS